MHNSSRFDVIDCGVTAQQSLRAQKATKGGVGKSGLFDQLTGLAEQCRWHRQFERLGRLQIDQEIEFGRQHDRQVGRLFALEDAADIGSGVLVALGDVGPITDPPAAAYSRN